MKKLTLLIFGCLFFTFAKSQTVAKMPQNKRSIVESVERHSKDLIQLSDSIWAFAETALTEYKSSKLLADYAQAQGFKVERGVANMPTAFIASYGSGQPIIAVLGEFDALPGISQKATPQKEALKKDAAGHGCGHNLFGAGSLGAAIAVKELIEQGKLKGTVRFYGTPAEEAVGGKIYMVREGLFKDVDVCLDWHPDSDTKASVQSSQAMIDFNVEFMGKSAHAAYDPWNGRSAVDAMELFTHAMNMMREHVKPTVRIHYTLVKGGDVPNVVPAYAKVWMWIRDSKRSVVQEVFKRAQKAAQGAALMTETEYKISINSGDYEVLVNRTGGTAMHKNLEMLGAIQYTEEETVFAKQIQAANDMEQLGLDGSIKPLEETLKDPPGGSTDVGDVSWVVPEICLVVTTAPVNTPWHSWSVVACGGMSIGHKGLVHAAKALGMTMTDLFENEQLRKDIRKEFDLKKGKEVYKAMIPDGLPPVPARN